MDVSVSLQDILKYYLNDICLKELLSTCGNSPPSSEELWRSVRKTREILILLATVLGAFPRKKLEQISRLSRKSLALENRFYKVERLGEDMAALRGWVRNAQDGQWSIGQATRMLGFDRNESLPMLTSDLILSVKKPFVVVRYAGKESENLQLRLSERLLGRLAVWKKERVVPERVHLEICSGAEVIVSSFGEFKIKAIFDTKRWFILEADLFDGRNFQVAEAFRNLLQNSCEDKLIPCAFRVVSRARLRQWVLDAGLKKFGLSAVERTGENALFIKFRYCTSAPLHCFLTAEIGTDGDLLVTQSIDGIQEIITPVPSSFDDLSQMFYNKIKKAIINQVPASIPHCKLFTIGEGDLLAEVNGVLFLIGVTFKGSLSVRAPALMASETRTSSLPSLQSLLEDLSRRHV